MVERTKKATGKVLSLDSSYPSASGKVLMKARYLWTAQLKAHSMAHQTAVIEIA